jgi:hypothetical protein
MSALPFVCRWRDDKVLEPVGRSRHECDAQFIVGKIYRLDNIEDRSAKSHSYYFACLAEAWRNLPEDQSERFPTPDHLRKFSLIKQGFRDERSIVCGSNALALRIAAFVRPMDEFAVVTVANSVVRVWTAKSQSLSAMGKVDFEASKNAVLGYVATLIGTSADELAKNAGAAA